MTKADLIALAERVERAEGPNYALDCEIAVAVWWAKWGKKRPKDIRVPAYTASLDAAMTLVPDGLYPTIDFVSKRVWVRDAKGFDVGFSPAYGFAATVPLSICTASLRAIAEEMDG